MIATKLTPRLHPVTVTKNAWDKFRNVIKSDSKYLAFLFSAEGGGCNGFNYSLKAINHDEYQSLTAKNSPSIKNNQLELIIEPSSELLLLGTTIDYVKQDYSKNIYENKFTFKPKQEYATTCGCGTSFSPK